MTVMFKISISFYFVQLNEQTFPALPCTINYFISFADFYFFLRYYNNSCMSVQDCFQIVIFRQYKTKAHCLGFTQKSCRNPLLNSQIYCIHMQAPIVTHTKCPSIQIYIHNLYPFTHNTTMSPYLHMPLCHSTISALLLHHQQHQTENLYSPLCLSFIRVTMRSRSSSCSPSPCSCLAGGRQQVQQARQIYGGGGDLWGRNTVMGEWLSTVSYWHLTKCPKQNEFTSLFLNHQAATALTPILTAITRSPISQGPEKFTVTSTFQ